MVGRLISWHLSFLADTSQEIVLLRLFLMETEVTVNVLPFWAQEPVAPSSGFFLPFWDIPLNFPSLVSTIHIFLMDMRALMRSFIIAMRFSGIPRFFMRLITNSIILAVSSLYVPSAPAKLVAGKRKSAARAVKRTFFLTLPFFM